MAAPWEKYAAPPTNAPAPPGVLGTIPGRVDPYKARDQQLQEEANARAREAERRAEEDQRFQREKFEREQAADRAKQTADPKLVESERIAGFLATRVAGGIGDISRALKDNPDEEKPGIGATIVGGVFGETGRNFANSPARQRIEAAQTDVLDAALTLGTGAAYTREQIEGYRRSHFPQLGDDPQTVADKELRLRRLLEAAKLKAGNSAPMIGQALAAIGGAQAPEAADAPDEVKQEMDRRLVRGDDPSEIIQWLISINRPPNKEEIARIIANQGNPDASAVHASRSPGGELLGEFAEQTGNIAAGAAQGLTALPDLAATSVGKVLSVPVEAAGFPNAAAGLRDPFTFGGAVESIAPTPEDTMGRVNRFGGQFLGGALGLPQRVVQNVANRIVGSAPPPPPMPNALGPSGGSVMRAADELSASTRTPVQPIAADVAGPTTRRLTAAGAQLPFSAAPIVNASQRLNTQAQAARDVVASRAGAIVDPETLGETARRGMETYRVRTGQQARSMYDEAAKAAEGAPIEPRAVLERLGEHIRQLNEIPGGSDVLPVLQNLAVSLTKNGQFTVEGVRGMRTALRSRMTATGMTPSNADRILNDLMQAASDDISTSLTRAGKPDAAKAYRSADKFYAERMDTIKKVLEPVLGRNNDKSAEDVAKGLGAAVKNNAGRLAQIMRVLPEDDAATVRASVIGQLGKASKGAQGAEGNSFSLSAFLTHWNDVPPRARSILFDREILRDLNNLAVVAEGSKQAARYANSSNTGGVVGTLATGGTLAIDFLTTAGTAIAQFGGGHLLAAPGFARWLAKSPKNPSAQPGHIKRLSAVATRNPALADDILGIQQRLIESFGQPGRLAAEQDVTNVGPQPPQ